MAIHVFVCEQHSHGKTLMKALFSPIPGFVYNTEFTAAEFTVCQHTCDLQKIKVSMHILKQ